MHQTFYEDKRFHPATSFLRFSSYISIIPRIPQSVFRAYDACSMTIHIYVVRQGRIVIYTYNTHSLTLIQTLCKESFYYKAVCCKNKGLNACTIAIRWYKYLSIVEPSWDFTFLKETCIHLNFVACVVTVTEKPNIPKLLRQVAWTLYLQRPRTKKFF